MKSVMKRTKNNKNQKRRFAWVIGILSICFVLLGAGAAYAYPYVNDVVIPKKKLASAIQNECGALQDSVNMKLTQMKEEITDTGIHYSGALTWNQQMVNQRDLMDDFKVDTATFEIDVQTQVEAMSGEIYLQNGTEGESKLQIQFFADASSIVVKIPEVFDDSLMLHYADTKYEKEFSYLFKSIITILGNPDQHSIEEYETSIQAAAKDVAAGLKVMLENCTIKKNDHMVLAGVNGQEKVMALELTITPQAIYKGLETTIESAYSDQELNSYLTLVATYTGMSKNEILEHCSEMTSKLEDIPMILCISDDNRIISFDLKLNQPQLGINLELIAGSIEDQKITDHTTYELIVHQADAITDVWNQYIPELTLTGCSGQVIISINKNENELKLHELRAAGHVRAEIPMELTESGEELVKEADVDLRYSGNIRRQVTAITKQEIEKKKNELMKQNIRVAYIDQAQLDRLWDQLQNNSNVIKGLCNDELYDAIYN